MTIEETPNYADMPLHVARKQNLLPGKLYDFLNVRMGEDRPTVATLGLLCERYKKEPEFLANYKGLQSRGKKFTELQAELENVFTKPELSDLMKTEEAENVVSQEDWETALNMLDDAERDKNKAQLEAANLKAELGKARNQIENLKTKLAAPPTIENLLPRDLSIIGEWASAIYPGRLLITPRALSEVQNPKHNVYRSPERVYSGLSALATDFREAKLLPAGMLQQNAHARYQTALMAHGITDSASLSRTAASKFGSLYKAQVGDTSYVLTEHLKHGTSRDPRDCMRVYYTFDQDKGVVVIGSLPRHLNNALT